MDHQADEIHDSSRQSPNRGTDRRGRNLGWLVLACGLITAIVCVFSWVATFGLLPRRALASGESMLAADYSPWEGYRVLNLDVVRLATAAAQGDAPWQEDGVTVAEVTLPPPTAVQITSQATPLPTLVPTTVPPTRRPRLPGPTNTLPPTIPVVTSTSTTAPTSPPPPPAPTSPPPAPTSLPPAATNTPTATPDTPTPTPTETPTATPDTPTATATMTPTSYEAEAPGNTFSGATAVDSTTCSANCSGGAEVRWIGNGAGNHVTINNINVPAAGNYTLTIDYLVSGTRSFFLSVNGGAGIEIIVSGSSWTTPASALITVTLNAGSNNIRFYNDSDYAPDLDRIIVQ